MRLCYVNHGLGEGAAQNADGDAYRSPWSESFNSYHLSGAGNWGAGEFDGEIDLAVQLRLEMSEEKNRFFAHISDHTYMSIPALCNDLKGKYHTRSRT